MRDEDACAAVAAAIAQVKGLDCPPTPGQRLFEDVGLTSFDMMVVCVRLEELAGHPLTFGSLSGARTVVDLARLVAAPA